MSSKKGQFFSYDSLIATIAFLLVFAVLTVYWFNLRAIMNSPHELLVEDGIRIADSLVTPGTPFEWPSSTDTAKQFGLTTDWESNVINESKVVALRSVATSNYTSVKDRFRTAYEFYITLEDKNGNILNEMGNAPTPRAVQRINIERIVVYRNSTAKLRLQLWNNEV